MRAYPETHQQGIISVEQKMEMGTKEGDFGIQIAEDGRVWICVDGVALVRFKPYRREEK
jgi:streptogramin lyase